MAGEVEAIGDVLTGTALARAIEPPAGEVSAAGGSCLNCGAALRGGYCHVCGQKAEVHRSLGAFWHDFTHSILHFEGKIWRTLPLLFFRPGELTRRYIHGERARFVSPLALFLFSIFLMFAVFSTVGLPVRADPAFTDGGARVEGRKALSEELTRIRARVAQLEGRRSNGQVTPPTLEAQIADARRRIAVIEGGMRVTDETGGAIILDRIDFDTGNKDFDALVRHVLQNPQLLLYKMQSNAYKFSWALVIISLPFVALPFAWKRRFHQFDHLVFVTYSLCFMTLLLVTGSFLTAAGLSGLVGWLIVLAPPAHIFSQLRGAYSLSAKSAIWRTAYLLASAFIVLLIFGLILFGLGL